MSEELRTYRALMVDPCAQGTVLGELPVSGGSVTWDYYSDTRVGARLSVPDWSAWVPGSWLRLVEEPGGRVLFTGFVDSADGTWSQGRWSAEPQLYSALKAVEYDLMPEPLTVGPGVAASAVAARALDGAGRPWRLLPGFGDSRFTSARLVDAGESRLSLLFDLCDMCGARLDVDGYGVVTLGRYTRPADRAPALTLDCNSPDSPVRAAGMTRDPGVWSVAGRSIVVFRDGESSVSGYADVGPGHPASPARRGFARAELHELQDMPEGDRTPARARELAARYLDSDSDGSAVWELSCDALPLVAGDTVDLVPEGARSPVRCLVVTADLQFRPEKLRLSLKEVGE